MSLITTIKSSSLQARKDKNAKLASLYSTLLAEAQMIGKNNGNRESTDSEVIAVIKKMINNANETITYINNIPVTLNDVDREQIANLRNEVFVLTNLLPAQLSNTELSLVLDNLMVLHNATTIKDMGKVMKALKEEHEGTYDGTEASKLFKEKIA